MVAAARRFTYTVGLGLALVPTSAWADDFAAGSLIVPMDTTYQNTGMFEAYGLVYELLRQGVPVRWMIKVGKANGQADFSAAGTDLRTNAVIAVHGYRGGPWVIDSADAAKALPVIKAWQLKYVNTTVHAATAAFTGDVSRVLVVAPSIAMMADGNQKIARKYMQAAKIPDSTGNLLWPDASPDMLSPLEISGPTSDDHRDGALFDEDGDPVYCQFMSMHWAVADAEDNPEVVAEMRQFLQHPTHLFAECQAVNAFENLAPHGFFLTSKGFLIGQQPNMYDYAQSDTPFAQIDGPFLSVGGSEPAYTLPPGETYKGADIVMITQKGTPVGVNDVWMTGFIDGVCPGLQWVPGLSALCLSAGKVSYLGGHEYDVALPISNNPKSQGTRLFLNSLFEAPCATAEGLPMIELVKSAPAVVDAPSITYDIDYLNNGAMPALEAVLVDTLPPGVTFVSATDNGQYADGTVTWDLGNLGDLEGGQVSVTVDLDAPGVYVNNARLDYRAGVNLLTFAAAPTMTEYMIGMATDSTSDTSGSGEMSGGSTSTSATAETTAGGDTGDSASSGATLTNSGGTDSSPTSGDPGTGGSGGGTGGTGGTTAEPTGSVPTGGGVEGSTDPTVGGTGGATDSAGEADTGGCACDSAGSPGWTLLAGLGVLTLRRRRRV